MKDEITEYEIESIVRKYSSLVYHIARTYTKSHYDADDIYQNVFLAYFKNCPKFENEEHRKAWFIRVTVNHSKKLLSCFWRKNVDLTENEPSFQTHEEGNVFNALCLLPAKYRLPLQLFYIEDYSTNEISRLLSLKKTTVRKRLSRGREMLRKDLNRRK